NINALLRLADIAASTGETRLAISLYSRVLVQNPDSSRAISGIAKLSGSTEPASQVAAPKQATTPPTSGPTYPPRFQNSLVGVVTDLHKSNAPWRGRMGAIVVWQFRVVANEEGRPRPAVGIEMKGDDISGLLQNGDWVEIDEQPQPGRTLRPKRVWNLSDGSVVKRTWRVFGSIIDIIKP
ncbi:MAG: tetratricopeptide repeat protein, partial [Verrucomicrobia bacterium]|nr:tetratricopeptide repeat protein [Verrucomicrobiota bacterium]